MVSSDGFETWFDYELLFLGLFVAFVVATTVWSRLTAYLGSLPLASPTFALAVTVVGLLVIVSLIGLTWLLNRERP